MRRAPSLCPCLAGVALALVALAGCDQDHPPGVAPGGEPRPPSGAGVGGGTGGGSPIGEVDITRCVVTPLEVSTDTSSSLVDFDVAGGTDDFLVAFTQEGGAVERVFSRRIDGNGNLGTVQFVTDGTTLVADPAVVATSSGFLVAFSEDNVGRFDVRATPVSPTGIPGIPRTISDELRASGDDVGAALVAAGSPDETLLAFSTIDEGVTQARIAPIDDEALLAGTVQPLSPAFGVDSTVDLASLGIGPSGIASFIDVQGDLQLLQLTPEGAASDIPTPITNPDDFLFTRAFDVAAGTNGGIAVVGFDRGTDDPALAVRTFDDAGVLADTVTPLFADTSVRGRSPAAVALDGVFAVAFRRTTPLGTTIRLMIVDANGNVLAERDIADTATSTGRVRLARAADGTLVAVFDEPLTGGGVTLEAARVVCP